MALERVAKQVITRLEPKDSASSLTGETAESLDPIDLEERILSLCMQNPKGIRDDVIVQDQPFISTEQRMKALQRLMSRGKIELLKQGTNLIYRLSTTASSPSKTKGFENDEKAVYQIIERAGSKGIWIRDIRMEAGKMNHVQVTKILRTLESKKLIKSVNSVQVPKKKVYMLSELTPDESVTGGAWYSDQDFESEFVEILNDHCYKFLEQKAFKAHSSHVDIISRKRASLASAEQVCKFISDLGISKISLTAGNIETILNTVVYDGKAERITVADGGGVSHLYRSIPLLTPSTGFSKIPCGVCPVINQCSDGGSISPANCLYMDKWLEF